MTTRSRSSRPTTPEDFPASPYAQPSGDYSYTLEIVMRMQEAIGRMEEAIGSLKAESANQRLMTDRISRDVHSAKVVFTILGSIIAFVITAGIALLGVGLNFYMGVHKH